MEFILSKKRPEETSCDLFAVTCFEEETKQGGRARPAKLMREDGGAALDRALGGELTRMINASSFSGAAGKMKLAYVEGRLPMRHILIVGMGKRKDATAATFRNAAAKIAKAADEIKARSAAVMLETRTLVGLNPPERIKAVVEAMELGRYSFDTYKAAASRAEKTLSKVILLTSSAGDAYERRIRTGLETSSAVILARNMGNTPGNDMTPRILAQFARDIARRGGLAYTEWGPSRIRRERMNAFLAVAQGSAEPPVFVHLRYAPRQAARRVAIVGKGITFDTGGISIKPVRGMEEMKDDMSGAAAVIAVMKAIAVLKPRVAVDAYILAAENMPDGKAIKPGDIVTARNGKTVEIISTDAEGRLLLADGLAYAAEKKPDYLIDVATLTGTCPYAVGEKYIGLMGSDQKLVDMIIKAGGEAGEPLWQLPLEKDYLKGLTAGDADLKNLGSSKADTISAGLFLGQFVGDTSWAHLDIASTAWSAEATDLSPKGATGAGVRVIIAFLMNL